MEEAYKLTNPMNIKYIPADMDTTSDSKEKTDRNKQWLKVIKNQGSRTLKRCGFFWPITGLRGLHIFKRTIHAIKEKYCIGIKALFINEHV